MPTPGQPEVKWVPVDADQFESISYLITSRQLFIKFRNSPPMVFEGVPGFRYQGLLNAPRKDAYYNTFIKSSFLKKEFSAHG